jgi:hypothetical protein
VAFLFCIMVSDNPCVVAAEMCFGCCCRAMSASFGFHVTILKKKNSVALRPQANYTAWVTATCWWNLMPTFADRGVSRGQRGRHVTILSLLIQYIGRDLHLIALRQIQDLVARFTVTILNCSDFIAINNFLSGQLMIVFLWRITHFIILMALYLAREFDIYVCVCVYIYIIYFSLFLNLNEGYL